MCIRDSFTTKPVGEGTGLGLDISWRIVVNKHHGDLSVTSVPGDTRFRVLLPLTAPVTEQLGGDMADGSDNTVGSRDLTEHRDHSGSSDNTGSSDNNDPGRHV